MKDIRINKILLREFILNIIHNLLSLSARKSWNTSLEFIEQTSSKNRYKTSLMI